MRTKCLLSITNTAVLLAKVLGNLRMVARTERPINKELNNSVILHILAHLPAVWCGGS